MKKTLVTVDNVKSYICESTGTFYMDNSSMILTPGAKDELCKQKVAISYEPRPACGNDSLPIHPFTDEKKNIAVDPFAGILAVDSNCKGCGAGLVGSGSSEIEKLLLTIANMLQDEFGITDPQELRKLSYQVITTLQKHI